MSLGSLLSRRQILALFPVLDNRPVKDIVVDVALTNKEVSEEFAEVRVVGFVVEPERATVVEVCHEFVREASVFLCRVSMILYRKVKRHNAPH